MNYKIHAKGYVPKILKCTHPCKQAIHQYRLAMKLTLYLLLAINISVSANAIAQKIDLNVANESLEVTLKTLRKQSGYSFVYNSHFIKNAIPVSVHVKDMDILNVLPLVFSDQPFDFSVKGKVVTIIPKQTNLISNNITQQSTIKGLVTDSLGNPLQGVTVQFKNTSRQTATDRSGNYEMTDVPENTTLVFRLLGYETIEFLADRPVINVVLKTIQSLLEEVFVNAGYWDVSDRLKTGNITKVSGETIRQQPVSDPMLALAGRIAGLNIRQGSGIPGDYTFLQIRGVNSIANGNNPLFIIDGVPFSSDQLSDRSIGGGAAFLGPFALINAQEIESIEILKDADATAIYGSRGANGVVLITTKKGQVGQTRFNVNAYTGAGKVTRMMEMLNTQQYLEMRREAFKNDGITTYPANAYDINGTWDTTRYTDWQKVLVGNTARISNIQAQVSGGSAQTQFTAGGGLMNESTVLPGNFNTQKSSVNFNINHRSTNNKFGISLSGRFLDNKSVQPGGGTLSIYTFGLPPNAPAIYDASGNFNWENNTWDNPIAAITKSRARANTKNIIGNSRLDYQISEALQATVSLGYNEVLTGQSIITPSIRYNPVMAQNPILRNHRHARNDITTWIVEPQLDFNKVFMGGKLDVTTGFTFQETNKNTLSLSASNFQDDALLENIQAASSLTIFSNRQSLYRYAALFGRINYNWQDKYLLNLVARRDGSSRFGLGKRFGNFGAVGVAWVFSNESLFDNTILSFGKLRGSYGITGNDQFEDYQYLSTYSSYNFPYLDMTGLYPTRLDNPDYAWETVHKLEANLDLGFLKDRIKISTAAYKNRTGNQLVGYSLPTMTGFSSIQANLPAVIENRGLEMELNTVNIQSRTFNWKSAFNISFQENRLVNYPDLENSSYRNRYEIGKPLSIQKKWHWTGVDPQTGLHTFEDVDSDGRISSPQDLQALVATAPRFFGGFANTLSYKGFELDVFFQFVKQNGVLESLGNPGVMNNQPTWVLNRWRNPGDITDVQRFTQSGAALTIMNNARNSSDMIYVDASFIRLKTLSISYQLPNSWSQNLWLKQCRVFMQGQNLLTLTGYQGPDPETQSRLAPIVMLTGGINITL